MTRAPACAAALVLLACAASTARGDAAESNAATTRPGSSPSPRATCAARPFLVAFSPRLGVVVASGGRTLASASAARRAVPGGCAARTGAAGSAAGLGAPRRGAHGPRCAAPQPIEIAVRAVGRGNAGRSTLTVTAGTSRTVLVEAVARRARGTVDARLAHDPKHCRVAARVFTLPR